MWRPVEDAGPYNRALVSLEQALLAAYRGGRSIDSLQEPLDAVFPFVDENPYQAVAMARIKSGHAMTPRHGINVLLTARAWALTAHRFGAGLLDFSVAAFLHDLGHHRPQSDLLFEQAPYTHTQMHEMRRHTQLEAIEPDSLLLSARVRDWILQHHEQPDGRGYPSGSTQPPAPAQMLRIVDCYEGLTTARRFRSTLTPHDALELMSRWAGYKYDAGLFQSFKGFMGAWPLGSFVRLESGPMAVTLPPEDKQVPVLIMTNSDGDVLEGQERRVMSLNEIAGESIHWQELDILEPWKNVRPDLLSMPRFF